MKPTDRNQHSEFSRNQGLYEQLEQRILFDAVPDASLELLGIDNAEDPFALQVDSQNVADATPSASEGEAIQQQASREVLFVDKAVKNYEPLVAKLMEATELTVRFLDSHSDGVEQIAATLEAMTNISAIHLVSHGDDGTLDLGTATLNSISLSEQYADEFDAIRAVLTNDADLLIYGCNVAQTEDGQAFVDQLSQATGQTSPPRMT